jgi:hypothetical protein
VAGAAIEALAPARPLVQQILEDTLLERASSTEVEAVRAVPRMHEATPARALALFDVHFGLPAWNPKMRVRLADLLARVGHYQDVVPVLVGLADEMQAAGQPARALAMLGKIVSLGVRSCGELEVAPLPLEPVAPRPGPPGAILTYVVQGRPAPPAQASQEFRGWLQELMGEARGEEPVQADAAADGEEEEDAAAVEELAAALAAEPEAPAEPARAAIPAGARQ